LLDSERDKEVLGAVCFFTLAEGSLLAVAVAVAERHFKGHLAEHYCNLREGQYLFNTY